MKGTVGASIVSIITESLYDKPIVVFREYIQNAADALDKANAIENSEDYSAQIWADGDNLFFLDNGTGIKSDKFKEKMTRIADSGKNKVENIGYKGIGRLSGIPYCKKLCFINIIDYANCKFQEFIIDGEKYADIRKSEEYNDLDFDTLMFRIGTLLENSAKNIGNLIGGHSDLFAKRNTGFLVVLEDITTVLRNVMEDEQFLDDLGWLLPVPFKPELVSPAINENTGYELFSELAQPIDSSLNTAIPAKSFRIYYNGERIYRPITCDMLRTYLCQSNFAQYAICVHTFSNKKIELNRKNPFSGIRIYIDNMLLCDENELIPALHQYGLTRHGTYELIQSVRGIGAMIYIIDKVNISANARRTFIDVTDEDSFRFLALIGEFVNSIYQARYALSGYNSAKLKDENDQDKLNDYRKTAQKALEILAKREVELEDKYKEPADFSSLVITEQKRIIKNTISKEINTCIKKYLSQTADFNPETCFKDFKTWLSVN